MMEKADLFDDDPVRVQVFKEIAKSGKDMASLSRQLDRNHAYLQQFLKRGVPRQLPERIRIKLSELLAVPERHFRPPDLPDAGMSLSSEAGARGIPEGAIAEPDMRMGLGPGTMPIALADNAGGMTFSAEAVRDWWRLPSWFLARFNVRPEHVVAFPTQGDSMAPTIADGDVVFIDTRHRVPSPDGLYAIGDDFGGVTVKRLEVSSRPGEDPMMLRVIPDNPRHAAKEMSAEEVRILGRYIAKVTAY